MKINYQYQTKKRIYELTDHLGNVRAVIKREKDANNRAQIIKASDYYPFGMEMPGRKYSSEAYRYDYQGQFAEKDGETGLHSFEARLWDARIARWTSMDPVENFYSPYAGMHNNPLSQVDPDGRNPLLIAMAIGAAIGGYTGYKVGQAAGADGLELAVYILGGAAIGGLSGYAAGTIAASGGVMANTMAITYSSLFNTMAMSGMSGGKTDVSVSFGAGSYNFSSGEWGYLGKDGNSTLQNIGYGFGALGNLTDAVSLFSGGGENISANSAKPTKDDWWGHHSLTKGEKTLVSVGPDSRVELYDPITGNKHSLSQVFKNSVKGAKKWDNYYKAPGTWKVSLNNVSKRVLADYSASRWDLLFNSCVSHSAKALWKAGVPNLFGFHPHLLNTQLFVRQIGIYSSPYLYQIP